MNDHADAIGDALLMAERLYYGNVKENVEAYHWNGDDKTDGSVSIDAIKDEYGEDISAVQRRTHIVKKVWVKKGN
ncbi:MAG: hypothetical protein J6N70_08065 [Oribacterium sp.]|nr:hypothetical protein [Oribacterium sp.]